MSAGSGLEKVIIRTGLGRLGYTVLSGNNSNAVFVTLTEEQPTGFRSRHLEVPLKGQKTLDLSGLIELMVSDEHDACDLRPMI